MWDNVIISKRILNVICLMNYHIEIILKTSKKKYFYLFINYNFLMSITDTIK